MEGSCGGIPLFFYEFEYAHHNVEAWASSRAQIGDKPGVAKRLSPKTARGHTALREEALRLSQKIVAGEHGSII